MILPIANLLSAEELHHITTTLDAAQFVDGQVTAGWHAKQVKHNTQLEQQAIEAPALRQLIQTALSRNVLFQMAAQPKTIHSIRFSRYEIGMSYGSHVDNALMGGHRSDLSFTVFLSAPEAYEGGELVIEYGDGDRAYKLDAGTAIVYPASTLHQVKPVTQGTRLVAVGWVQSLVRNLQEREILFELDTVRRSLFAKDGKTTEFDLLSKCYSNLLRTWAE